MRLKLDENLAAAPSIFSGKRVMMWQPWRRKISSRRPIKH